MNDESVILPLPGWARLVRLTAILAFACGVAASEARAQAISFGKSTLQGTGLTSPTALQFGPDGRLYVTQQNGTILIYTITRNGPNSYVVSATQTITSVRDIPNRNDNGALNASVTGRQVTGILVVGTAANPVLYVASSDPRIGAGSSGSDSNLDTNSGILSRLTWSGSAWVKIDLVRGLPRSEENHAANGMALIHSGNTLLVAQGGNTNMGAPSNNFALLPEYALSAAILSVDLAAIGNTTYDLPTLDDPAPSRNSGTPGVDTNDPFGGNDGANQAKLVAGGPVQVYAPGFRNPYDLVVNRVGRLYTIDNGPNSGWGDVPQGEGGTNCTNATREPGVTHEDNLHYVTGPGFYGGHPNPTRANTANTFNGQSPVPSSNPVECDYRTPGSPQDGSLATFVFSTNGMVEYTASNFSGALDGNLLTAAFDNTIYRIALSANGTTATLVAPLFSSVGVTPLDVWAQGTAGPFPGSVWVADYSADSIVVYEPADFVSCTGADDPGLDEDGDGFSNADEIDNGTSPCSAGDVPPDWDGDHVSNLNDPDDDNDGLPDTSDRFAIDAQNGATTDLPLLLTWDNDAPSPGGLLDLGFTGLMTNGTSNYASLFDPGAMTAGGAAGVVTVDAVPDGDASGAFNTQQYGLQVGVHVTAATPLFTAHTRILAPFAGLTPGNFQSMGLFAGTGDQDHYVKIVVGADGGTGVQFGQEDGGPLVTRPAAPVTLPGPDWIDLYLTIDPAARTATPSFIVTTANVPGPVESLGGPATLPASWFAGPQGLAVGILGTSRGPAPPFPATWDFLKVRAGPAVECSTDPECADTNPCTTDVCQSYTCLHLNNSDPCSDGIACTSGDVCAAGTCSGTDSCPAGQMCDTAANACVLLNVDLDNDGLVGAADPCPTAARNLCFGPVAVETAQGRTIRINAGVQGGECSGPKMDCSGRSWNADYGYSSPSAVASCNLGGGGEGCVISGIPAIFGCDDETTEDLFQCEHFDDEDPPELSYAFAVPNGPYLVNLYFANTYTGTDLVGLRVFDILIEGALAYDNFDQVAAAGGSGIASVRSRVVNVADGTLNISFGHVVENPAIKAIEVLRQDRDADGFFPPADCNDLNAAVHPGAGDNTCNGVDENCSGVADEGFVPSAETCDGADNDCNGLIDDAPALQGIASLTVGTGPAPSEAALSWGAVPGASAYDLVRGDVRALVESGGAFDLAIDVCLADGTVAMGMVESGTPAAGEGYFYILRGVNCGGGTWESGGAGQAAPRGPSFALSATACP